MTAQQGHNVAMMRGNAEQIKRSMDELTAFLSYANIDTNKDDAEYLWEELHRLSTQLNQLASHYVRQADNVLFID